MADTDAPDVAAEFASLLSAAAEEASPSPGEGPAGPGDEAPYGYKADGTPRRSNGGRPKRAPSAEELKARSGARTENGRFAAPEAPPEDRAPDSRHRHGKSRADKAAEPVPQYREGQIAKGMNKMYRRAGKVIRAFDHDTGTAFIEATRKELLDDGEPDPEDITVGEAWDELACTNPRIRRFLLKMIAGGAWGQLFMAHAPILLVVMMKEPVRGLIPFSRILMSMAEPDDDTPEGEGGLPGGMTAADVAEASRLAQEQMAGMGFTVPPAMAAMVESRFTGGGQAPPGLARTQPRHQSRAKRRGR